MTTHIIVAIQNQEFHIRDPHEVILDLFNLDKSIYMTKGSFKDLAKNMWFFICFIVFFNFLFIEYMPTLFEVISVLVVVYCSVIVAIEFFRIANSFIKINTKFRNPKTFIMYIIPMLIVMLI